MHARTLLALVSASMLFACTAPSVTGEEPLSTKSTPTGNPNADTSSANGSTTATSASASTASAGHALDGTWDITGAGDAAIAASQMTVKGGQFDGTIVAADEGQSDDNGCAITKDRMVFTATVTGDSLTATMTNTVTLTGDPDLCATDAPNVLTLDATRTHAASDATGPSALEGDWVVTPSDTSMVPFAVSVAGLVAKAWDSAAKDNPDPVFSITAANGAVSTTSASDRGLSFAARKR